MGKKLKLPARPQLPAVTPFRQTLPDLARIIEECHDRNQVAVLTLLGEEIFVVWASREFWEDVSREEFYRVVGQQVEGNLPPVQVVKKKTPKVLKTPDEIRNQMQELDNQKFQLAKRLIELGED